MEPRGVPLGEAFRFWLNDDRDSSGQDEKTGAVDSADNKVLHVRDLEDFAQIAIKIPTSIKDKIVSSFNWGRTLKNTASFLT
ncbi:MAG: hypothetical protein HYT80_07490, partial [Euryarchaeota archaeon]|nr:hypothetical protein [Euryarchaeota archaeon]